MLYYRQSKRGTNGEQRQRLPEDWKKKLDKLPKVWYTKDNQRGDYPKESRLDGRGQGKFPLDKLPKVCYTKGTARPLTPRTAQPLCPNRQRKLSPIHHCGQLSPSWLNRGCTLKTEHRCYTGATARQVGLVWEWGHSDSMSAVEDCEKPQVQRSESGTTTQFVGVVLLRLKINPVCVEWITPCKKGGVLGQSVT